MSKKCERFFGRGVGSVFLIIKMRLILRKANSIFKSLTRILKKPQIIKVCVDTKKSHQDLQKVRPRSQNNRLIKKGVLPSFWKKLPRSLKSAYDIFKDHLSESLETIIVKKSKCSLSMFTPRNLDS